MNLPLTQSAASMVKNVQKFSTRSSAIDKLLSGGLSCGHILEISGPPGTPKEVVAANIVTSFVEADNEVLFIGHQFKRISETICP
jgi:RAD51-like protein 2